MSNNTTNHHNANTHNGHSSNNSGQHPRTIRIENQQREFDAFSSSCGDASGSVQSFSPNNINDNNRQQQSYEPGTGAHFMAQSGWNNRDQYGHPRQSVIVDDLPIFTPAPRQPHQQPVQPRRQHQSSISAPKGAQQPPHRVTFSNGPNYRQIYLITLIIICILLLAIIALLIIFLATKVIVYMGFSSYTIPTTSTTTQMPPLSLSPSHSAEQLHLVTRTFECEMFILDQANQAYDNPNSFELFQAQTIVQNALISTFEHSTLRDMNPTVNVQRIDNSESDLRVVFRLDIVALEQQQNNSNIKEQSIRNILLAESGLLEAYLNRTNLDRTRISVQSIT